MKAAKEMQIGWRWGGGDGEHGLVNCLRPGAWHHSGGVSILFRAEEIKPEKKPSTAKRTAFFPRREFKYDISKNS